MKPLEIIWRPLVERRLLPVAIVLVAALAAIPFLLKKDPAPVTPPATAPAADQALADNPATEKPVVSLVTDGDQAKRRRVLGTRKNPFEPAAAAPTPTPSATPSAATTQITGGAPTGGTTTTTTTTPGGSSAPSSGPPAATPPASAPPAAPKPKYELYSLTVRFGSTDQDSMPKLNLPRLKALPGAADPLLVYLGLTKNGKSAIFMVDSNVEPQGDGTCNPSPANCETIRLRVGDTEFFDVKDEQGNTTAQYQLDLVKIRRSTTASASKAKAAHAKVSKSGRAVLRERKAADGPLRWQYDAKSGTLRKLDAKAYRAAVAKTARIALAFSGGF